MSLMKDELADSRKKWKKVRYGRAVAQLKIRAPNGRLVYYDPTKHQHQLKSFAKKEAQIHEVIDSVPISSLTWSIDQLKETVPVASSVHPDRIKQISAIKQLTSIEQKAELLQQKKAILQAALSNLDAKVLPPNPNRIVFDSDSESETQRQDTSLFENSDDETEHQQARTSLFDESDQKNDQPKSKGLFDSSSDEESINDFEKSDAADGKFLFGEEEESGRDEDNDGAAFDIKRVFEGEQGQQRLKMQRRFGNDPRFKLDDKFIDSDEESLNEEPLPETAEAQMEADFAVEKSKALSVLQDVLGLAPSSTTLDVAVAKKQTGVEWKEMVRYDPDAPDAEELVIDAKELMPASQIKKPVVQPIPAPQPTPQPSLPVVSSEKYFTVSDSIGNLFSKDAPKTDGGLFSFMPSDDEDEESPAPNFLGLKPTPAADPVDFITAPINVDAGTSSTKEPPFFFHLGNPDLAINLSDGKPIFYRTDPVEFLETEWSFRRKQMIRGFKSLQKRNTALARKGKLRSQ
ncbi:nucleolar protein 8, variant 2 [Entomophthora muscae]|nr:nucleolar protein 8, variant 2 [Entomophthora muscae]